MRRRDFLGALAAPLLLAGCDFDLSDGIFNECRTSLAPNSLVAGAWEGLQPDKVWDVHVHLFGNGRGERGVWIDPDFDHGWGPANRARRAFFMNAACAGTDEDRLDGSMVKRLAGLADQFPPGAKAMLLAFDFTYDDRGQRRPDLTTFSISNEYAQSVVKARPDRFEWNASVHPYREDAVAALEAAKAAGARAVKWLPPTMNIDMANPRCRPVYDALVRLDLPLLVHVGDEKAVPGAERGDLANPLLLRHPLDAGVRCIAAHCASLGAGNLEKFEQLMADRHYEHLLVGDISAITQANRHGVVRRILLQRDWDGRLLNGSDYPLPGVKPLFSLHGLVKEGVLDGAHVEILKQIRETNALLFDFVLKRQLRVGTRRFPDVTFETRAFFERRA